MTNGQSMDDAEWSVLLRWWSVDGYQYRIRVKHIPGSAHWTVQKQSRGPGGAYTVDWTVESRSKPKMPEVVRYV